MVFRYATSCNYYLNVNDCPGVFLLRLSHFNKDHTKLYQDRAHSTQLFKVRNLAINVYGFWNGTTANTVSRT